MAQRILSAGIDGALAGRYWTPDAGSPQSLFVLRDRQGTTLGAFKADGTADPLSWYQPLGAFGAPAGDGSSTSGGKGSATATGFTGAGAPSASGGYVYLRNRWYDPATGRFLTQDPIGLAGGINLYAYAGNDPVNFSDPFGLDTVDTDPGTRKRLEAECQRSSSFCEDFRRLDAHPTHWKLDVVGKDYQLPGDELSGNTSVNQLVVDWRPFGGVGVSRIILGGSIQIKPSDFDRNSRQEGGITFTFGTVASHEIGHAIGSIDGAAARPMSGNGVFLICGERCAKIHENRYRSRTNLGYRP